MSDTSARLASAISERYRVERELGTGGMATVYLAEDLRHGRKVALKVLREEIASALGATRFLREVAIAAQLQHPNILPLHDSGEAGGLLYYVMPFVDGPSLRERLAREHELPIGEAVRLLIEIVDALTYAHAHGVVHRDMKPDNVMLSGRHALISDFGVAKAVSDATGAAVTTAGVALGTPAYMAPEQATGDAVDHRADIYAVGVMAYELLTGVRPFGGDVPQQVLAAHALVAPVPVSQRRAPISPELERVVMRCLEKLPADRYQRSDELLADLESLATTVGAGTGGVSGRRATRARKVAAIAGAAVILLAALALAARWMSRDTPSLTLGRATQFTTEPGLEISPAISPDGRVVAYAAGSSARMHIFLKPIASGGRTLTLSDDTATVESQPAWSRDGGHVLFLSRGGVYTTSSLGGTLRQVVAGQADAPVTGAAWSPDGNEIAIVRNDSVIVYSAEGSLRRFVTRGSELYSCDWSPARTWLACVSGNPRYVEPGAFFANLSPSRIVLISMSDGRIVAATDSLSFNQGPHWSGDGRSLYFISNREGTRDIYVTALGPDGRPRGTASRVTTGLNVHSFSIDAAGSRLSYALYQERGNIWSLPVPERPPVSITGAVQVTSGSQTVEIVRAFGDWLLFDSNLNGNSDIYRIPLGGGTVQRLTSDPADDFAAALAPDGREFAFHSFRTGSRDIFLQRIGDDSAHQLTNTGAQECCVSWSPDGRAIAFADFSSTGRLSIMRRDSAGGWSAPVQRLPRGFINVWAPDGRTIAVATGRTIRGALQAERLELVPVDSGAPTVLYAVRDTINDPSVGDPTWSPDGKGLYFKSHDVNGRASFWYVPVSGGRPRLLVRFDDPDRPSFRFNFGTDGKRFFFAINDRQSDIWVAEVSKK
ncbi:MAG TPA: protein kinase [Gemmatimonadaceae bacterium]